MVRRRGLCPRRLEPWRHRTHARPSFETPSYCRAGLRPDPLARLLKVRVLSAESALSARRRRLREIDVEAELEGVVLAPVVVVEQRRGGRGVVGRVSPPGMLEFQ